MNKPVRVLKFGGASLSSRQELSHLAQVVQDVLRDNFNPVIVVSSLEKTKQKLRAAAESALNGTGKHGAILDDLRRQYRRLIEANLCASKRAEADAEIDAIFVQIGDVIQGISLVQDITARTYDLLLSQAELTTAVCLAYFFRNNFPETSLHDPRQLIQTDNSFGCAVVDISASSSRIKSALLNCAGAAIIAGGVGAAASGETTTLGDGGADYTAAVIGAALGAEEVQLWTDVNGIMTADPHKVSKAFTIPLLSFEEAMELCHFGAKVIFPQAMQPAFDAGIPIRIKNALNPSHPGSQITVATPEHQTIITGISSISSIALLRLQGSGMLGVAGTARRLFDALSKNNISIILITQASSEHSICFAIPPRAVKTAQKAIEQEFALEIKAHQIEPVLVESDLSVISAVGANMRNTPGIAGRFFQALGKNGINVRAIAQGSSELNISVVIQSSDEAKALNAVHDSLFLSEEKTVNLFIAGAGKVGARLIEQIKSQKQYLNSLKLDLRIVALANSRMLLVDTNGIEPNSWKERLANNAQSMNIEELISRMKQLNLPNSVFIDCSASTEMAARYRDILSASISIVTPNKKAASGRLDVYHALKQQAARANVKFFYETTVGAGLPVIGTLNDLILSGDEVHSIEAVLSGTLSYIFNNFLQGSSFSNIVRQADQLGYMEPDPRDDLSGADVGRKLLILAREMNLALEPEDVEVQSLVPENCREISGKDEFFAALAQSDAYYSTLLDQAACKQQVLRYIGTICDGHAAVSLQAIDAAHPFYSLSGSDNIISFKTKRYCDRPLVVKGPGAGVEVTAAGVLADIIRAAGYISV